MTQVYDTNSDAREGKEKNTDGPALMYCTPPSLSSAKSIIHFIFPVFGNFLRNS